MVLVNQESAVADSFFTNHLQKDQKRSKRITTYESLKTLKLYLYTFATC